MYRNMQSSSDYLRKKHDYDNYLYKHHSTNALSTCDISLCTETIKVSYSNPLARKVTLCDVSTVLFNEPKSQSQYLNHEKTCNKKINDVGVGVKHNSYHRHNLNIKSDLLYKPNECIVVVSNLSFSIVSNTNFSVSGIGSQDDPYIGESLIQGVNNGEAIIEFKVLNPGFLNVDFIVSSEASFDFGNVYLNNTSIFGGSGEAVFGPNEIIEVVTNDIIKFRYKKDNRTNTNDDKVTYKLFGTNKLENE